MPTYIPSTNSVELAVHDFGGDGPALVILHATGLHGYCYSAIAEQLTDIRHVYAPDLRGHGDSSLPNIAVDWNGMADDALAVVEWLGADGGVDMVGHSLGGGTIAKAEMRRPGTVRTAWLFEPIVWPTDAMRDDNAMAEQARRRRPTFESFADAVERYAGRPPFNTVDPRALRDYVEHGFRLSSDGVELKCTPETEAAVFSAVPHGVFDRLDEVTAPVSVVASGDGMPPALVAPRIAAALANATLTTWPDRTHFGPLEDPARAAAEIRAAIS